MHGQSQHEEQAGTGGSSADSQDRERTVQVAVAKIWATLLGVEQVEPEHNFLLLGGESLLAVQAASRIRELFNYELSIRSIFTRSVGEIAREIAAGQLVK